MVDGRFQRAQYPTSRDTRSPAIALERRRGGAEHLAAEAFLNERDDHDALALPSGRDREVRLQRGIRRDLSDRRQLTDDRRMRELASAVFAPADVRSQAALGDRHDEVGFVAARDL